MKVKIRYKCSTRHSYYLLIVNIAANTWTFLYRGRAGLYVPLWFSPFKMRIYSCITFLIKKWNVSKVILSNVGLTHLYPEMLSWVVENEMK